MPGAIFGISIPFGEHLGIEAVEEGAGFVRTALTIKPEMLNSWGVAHGGAMMTLLDLTLGMAARSLERECEGSITIELKTNFIAAAKGRLTAEGRALRSGKSLVFCEGEARDQSGAIVAKASGTFKLYRGQLK